MTEKVIAADGESRTGMTMREADVLIARPGASAGSVKVLIVVGGFPNGGGGRIAKLVKFLPDFGVEPIVLSAKESSFPKAEELAEVFQRRSYPAQLKAYRAASIGWSYFTERFLDRGPDAKHYRLLALLSFPERFVLVPDYMVRWIPHGIRLAKEIVRRENIQVVLTTSPPESNHLIGMNLKRSLGIRWVADFQDLWTEKKLLYRPATPLHDWWIKRLECNVFRTANYVIANTPGNAERHIQRFGLSRSRIDVIPNGFDRDDLIQHEAKPSLKVFRIGYAGAFDKHDFPWRIAMEALSKLAEEVGRDKVKLVHCGHLSKQFWAYLHERQMTDLVDAHGMLPHSDAMCLTANTDIRLLLLYENDYSMSIVPMKLYHYLIMKGPILAIAPEEGVTASIIAETRMGAVISPQRGVDPIYEQMKRYYLAWQRSDLMVDPDEAQIAHYDYRALTQRLAEILRRVAGQNDDGNIRERAE
jgi:glycosyltransferase involved in cell wall biosynthesis